LILPSLGLAKFTNVAIGVLPYSTSRLALIKKAEVAASRRQMTVGG
jgi:hypothetical protein